MFGESKIDENAKARQFIAILTKFPESRELVQKEHVTEALNFIDTKNSLHANSFLFTFYFCFAAERWRRYKNIMYRLTFSKSFTAKGLKYLILPIFVSGLIVENYEEQNMAKLNLISSNYDLEDEKFKEIIKKGLTSNNVSIRYEKTTS